jgi:hypothetical protein
MREPSMAAPSRGRAEACAKPNAMQPLVVPGRGVNPLDDEWIYDKIRKRRLSK